LEELQKACTAINYPYDVEELLECLKPPGPPRIFIWDIDPAGARKYVRGDHAPISSPRKPSSTKASHSSASSSHSLSAPKSKQLRGSQESTTFKGMSQLEALRVGLRNQHGSTVAAWRKALDPEMQGKISFGHFCNALSNGTFNGSVKVLWQQLSGGGTTICFGDIDAPVQGFLDDARRRVLESFGSLTEAWRHGFDVNGGRAVDQNTFVAASNRIMGPSPETLATRPDAGESIKRRHERWSRQLFGLLRGRPGQLLLTEKDFEALLIGVPPDDRPDVWCGKASTESEH